MNLLATKVVRFRLNLQKLRGLNSNTFPILRYTLITKCQTQPKKALECIHDA